MAAGDPEIAGQSVEVARRGGAQEERIS